MRLHSERWIASALLVAMPTVLSAQEQQRPMVPQIVVSAQGEAKVTPDKATISIGVQTRATTAADASAQNSRTACVIEQSRRRGAQAISTSSFNVNPEPGCREGQLARKQSATVSMSSPSTCRIDLAAGD